MFELAGWYLTGATDSKDDTSILPASEVEARRWVQLSADAGVPRAMFAMGYFLETGLGDTSNRTYSRKRGGRGGDLEAGMVWYRRAALAGDSKALQRLEKAGVDTAKLLSEKKKSSGGTWGVRGAGSESTPQWMRDSGLMLGSVNLSAQNSGFRFKGKRREEIPDEIDGGNKCIVM